MSGVSLFAIIIFIGAGVCAAVGCTVILMTLAVAAWACCRRLRRWVKGRAGSVEGLWRVLG